MIDSTETSFKSFTAGLFPRAFSIHKAKEETHYKLIKEKQKPLKRSFPYFSLMP